LHVGTEDAAAPVLTDTKRSRSFVVSDTASIALDAMRVTVA
jgi:hypothetical protein